jgi:UDP-2,3-diacylglucosamine pyrophosphatase LpxH
MWNWSGRKKVETLNIPEEFKRKCIELSEDGKTAREVYTEYYSKKYDATFEGFRAMLKKWKHLYENETHSNSTKEFDLIETLRKGIQLTELAERLNMSVKTCESYLEDIRGKGYNILSIGDEVKISNIVVPADNRVNKEWKGEKIIRFGLMGDTQINSKFTQLTHLHKFYDICLYEGIDTVYHTGDIDEGEQMRIGHQYECYEQGSDDHIKEIVKVYPKRSGITTHFITGNHDASIIKRCGYDIGYPIASQRDDMVYLGQSSAIINLTPNCTLELRHPIDGTAYAISYKMQKLIESLSGGEKPNILAVGHYHKAEYILYRNVHCFQTGCFQAQTPFMKGKQIAAFMGGWIVEVRVNDEGTITGIKQEYIPFYKAIADDWKNWR